MNKVTVVGAGKYGSMTALRIAEYDIVKEKDILIIAQLMRNILDDFSYEFGYINNEDVYDRVFSNFCIGK